MGALYLAIGVAIGAACGAIEQDNLEALIPTINFVGGINLVTAHVDAFRNARAECARGTNGIQVAIDTIQFLQVAGVNVPVDQATLGNIERSVQQIGAAVASNETVNGAFQTFLGRVPRAINTGVELAQAGIQAAQEGAQFALRQVTKPLIAQASTDPYTPAFRSALTDLSGLATSAAGRAQSSDPARVAEAETLLQQQSAALDTTWNGIDGREGAALETSQDAVEASARGADSSLEQFDRDMTALQGDVNDLANTTFILLQAEAANFSVNGLPAVQESFSSFGTSAASLVRELTSCEQIIQDTVS